MIVYNEEDLIQYTFPQIYDLADQIVIIDGSPFGPSTDATYQVLKPYLKSSKTYYESGTYGKVFEYTNSFNTVMRNEYLKHVSCDFILQLDADEFWTWDDLEKIKDAIQIDGVTGINTGNLHFYIDVFHYLPGLGINQHHRIVKNEPNAFYSALRPNSVLYKGKHIAIATSGTFLERKDITCFHVGHALPWEDYKRKQSKFYYKNLKRNCWNVNSIAELNALTEQRDFNHPKLTEYNGPYPEYMAQAIRDEHPFFIRRIPCRKQ